MKNQIIMKVVIGVLLVLIQSKTVEAANICVTNVTLAPCIEQNQTYVQFDVSWDASWRAEWIETGVTPNIAVTNWDAAWIFVKCRQAGTTNWTHASLSTNVSEHVAPAGAEISIGLSTNAGGTNFGCGAFLYRSEPGGGPWTNNVKLRWNLTADGMLTTSLVDVVVNAIEMVYVPQGSFYAGDGSANMVHGQFCSNTTGAVAYQVTNENYTITLGGGGAGSLGNNDATGMNTVDDFNNATPQTLPAAFPKGYNAFYCMKYEISQGQWVSFFNMLTDSQKAIRDITGGPYNSNGKGTDLETNRNTIAWTSGDAICTTPYRACNFLSWDDGVAYADWAGLMPMTELQFEKACRGPLTPVADEYAWGTATIMPADADRAINVTGPENGAETNQTSTVLGAAVYNDKQIGVDGVNAGLGPVRCGLFATAASTRITSGATYWGIMEMSGNLWERTVTVGNTNGRAFTGAVGDGTLDSSGYAHYGSWPDKWANGSGIRGSAWDNHWYYLRVSSRSAAPYVSSDRTFFFGFRAVRPALSGN